MEMQEKQVHLLFRIVRNRNGSTDPSSPTATTAEDDSRTHHQQTNVSSPPNVYSIHSLLNHSQYEYSTIKPRSLSRTNHSNGMRFFSSSIQTDH